MQETEVADKEKEKQEKAMWEEFKESVQRTKNTFEGNGYGGFKGNIPSMMPFYNIPIILCNQGESVSKFRYLISKLSEETTSLITASIGMPISEWLNKITTFTTSFTSKVPSPNTSLSDITSNAYQLGEDIGLIKGFICEIELKIKNAAGESSFPFPCDVKQFLSCTKEFLQNTENFLQFAYSNLQFQLIGGAPCESAFDKKPDGKNTPSFPKVSGRY
jgi:hypothetical protein